MDEIKKKNVNKTSDKNGNNKFSHATLESRPTNHNETSGQQKKKKTKEKINCYRGIQSTAAIIMALCTLVIAVITAVYTYYAKQQIIETRKAVKLAEDSSIASDKSMKNTLTEMRNQSKAIQITAEANKKTVQLYEQVVHSQQEQFMLDQRAWIKIKSVESREPLQSGENVYIKFTLNNTGKTPALRVNFNYNIWEEADGKTIKNCEVIGSNEFYYGPGDERYVTIATYDTMLQKEINDIYSGKIKLLMNISITYFDIYKTNKTRHTRVCYQYTPYFKGFTVGNRCSYMD